MTKFSSENQPDSNGRGKRGKSKKTLILDALKAAGKTEEGFYKHLVEEAMQPGNHIPLKEVLSRLYPADKATYPLVQINIPEKATPSQQIDCVVKAVTEGKVPADLGQILIGSIYKGLEAKEMSEIQERLDTLEKLLNEKQAGT